MVGTLGGSLLGVWSANKLTNYRIGQLEAKVDKHNQVLERLQQAQNDIVLLNQQVEGIKQKEETDREELKNEIGNIRDSVEEIKESMVDLNVSVNNLKGDISGVKTIINTYHKN